MCFLISSFDKVPDTVFKKKIIFGRAGSLLPCGLFSSRGQHGLPCTCDAHIGFNPGGFCSCGAQAGFSN